MPGLIQITFFIIAGKQELICFKIPYFFLNHHSIILWSIQLYCLISYSRLSFHFQQTVHFQFIFPFPMALYNLYIPTHILYSFLTYLSGLSPFYTFFGIAIFQDKYPFTHTASTNVSAPTAATMWVISHLYLQSWNIIYTYIAYFELPRGQLHLGLQSLPFRNVLVICLPNKFLIRTKLFGRGPEFQKGKIRTARDIHDNEPH